MTYIDMQDDLAARGARLAALHSVLKMAMLGLKFRGVSSPIAKAKMLGYTGPASYAKALAWCEAQQAQNLDAFQARNAGL